MNNIMILILCLEFNYNLIVMDNSKDISKEIYNTYDKLCKSNLYTKYPSTTYIGLHFRNMCCL